MELLVSDRWRHGGNFWPSTKWFSENSASFPEAPFSRRWVLNGPVWIPPHKQRGGGGKGEVPQCPVKVLKTFTPWTQWIALFRSILRTVSNVLSTAIDTTVDPVRGTLFDECNLLFGA